MKKELAILLAAMLVLAAGWAFWSMRESPEEVAEVGVEPPPPEPEAQEPPPPRYPVPAVTTESVDPVEPEPLPALADSDGEFELAMTEQFGPGIAELFVDDSLIEKIVTTIDNLPREQVAEKVRPIVPVTGPFAVDGQDDSGQFTVNIANYARYDLLINLLATADIDEVAATYRRYYPLFQEAYVNLGYPDGHFNDRAVEVIDHLLSTPEVSGPIELVRPHVLYEFADPALERLSSGQKLLLRTGDEHAVRIKQFLEELRAAITAAADRPLD